MRTIGITGPSSFSSEVFQMTESLLKAAPLPLYADNKDHLNHLLSLCDGVILAGGVDIHPRTYLQSCPSGQNMRAFDLRRDAREIHIIDECLKNKVPMFGICRGHQLLGLHVKKMSLLLDVCQESYVIHSPSRQEPKLDLVKDQPIHYVTVLADRHLFGSPKKTVKKDYLWVNSFHHQGLIFKDVMANDSEVVGVADVSDKRKIVELMVSTKQRWVSTQWHPEWDFREQESSRRVLEYWRDEFLAKGKDKEPKAEAPAKD